MKLIFAVAICIFAFGGSAGAQQSSSEKKAESQNSQPVCPMHDAHSQMNERGEKGMGFSQTATAHHFLLRTNGGAIEVKDPADVDGLNSVRMHLTHIAEAFQKGDFDIPMFVHDTVPPGVREMKRLQGNIHYSFEETPNGGQVVISSSDKAALLAIYQFLRFQIEEHETGDPTEIR
jgi:hypothetical protein